MKHEGGPLRKQVLGSIPGKIGSEYEPVSEKDRGAINSKVSKRVSVEWRLMSQREQSLWKDSIEKSS